MRLPLTLVASASLLVACGTSAGGGGGYYYDPGTGGVGGSDTTGSSAGSDAGSLGSGWSEWKPTQQQGGGFSADEYGGAEVETELDPSELFKEAALQCAEVIVDAQAKQVAGCKASANHANALGWAIQNAQLQIATDARLPGLDWKPQLAAPPYAAPTGQAITVYGCLDNPTPGGPGLNAFAMQQGVWMLDPLLYAFAESAAAWDAVREKTGPTLDAAAKEALTKAMFTIFLNAAGGAYGKVVPWDEVMARLSTSLFAWQTYVGAVSFVAFHEIGHANLSHGLIKCALSVGVDTLLQQRGITLDATQKQQLQTELSKIGRSTEAQADIYGLTMLKSAGFTKDGPIIFVLGMMGVTMAGCINAGVPSDQAATCALEAYDPATTSHPPLAERAALIQKIFDQNLDLTSLLQSANLSRVRTKECGDGTCQATESAQSCPDDCARRGPVCGDGLCAIGEASTCPGDCPPPHFCDAACGEQGDGCFCDAECKNAGDCCGPDGTNSGASTCAGSTCGLCN